MPQCGRLATHADPRLSPSPFSSLASTSGPLVGHSRTGPGERCYRRASEAAKPCDAPDDPGADATGRLGHERDASAEVQELRDGRRSFGHRGIGFGPVAVTSRCGTQSSTWLKPSKRTPPRMQPSYNERR